MISGGKRYKHTTCEPHSTVSDRVVWSVEADDTNIQLVNLTLQSQTKLYDQWRQTIQTYNLWTSLNSQKELYDQWRQTIQTYTLWTSLNSLRKSCMISGGRRYKHTTCEPHSTVSERAVWSVEADDTNIQLVNLTQQSQKELYDQWRQTIQTHNLWTSLYRLRQSCMISGGRRYKHITCEPHSTVSDRAVWSVEADDTNTQLVNLTLPSQTDQELYDQWRQTIQTHNLWTSLYSLRQSCMISGGRRYKHTTCEPHSTVSDRDVWSVEADDTNIQLVNLILQSQTEIYEQWRQTIQTYNLWTSPYSLRQSCMISGGRRYKHITCEPHSSVSDRAVWSVEADDTNIQLVNLTLQSQTAVWTVEADDTNIQPVNLTLQSQTELYHQWRQTIQTYNLWTSFCSYRQLHDQWRQTIQTYNLWTSLYSLRQSCMISGGRRYKHTTCEPHSAVTDIAVWSVEANDTNIQLVNLTLQSSLFSLRQSCVISGGRRYKHTTCEPHSTVSDSCMITGGRRYKHTTCEPHSAVSDSCMISGGRRYKHTTCEPHSAVSNSCMISGGRRYKHTTCEPHSSVSDRAVWSVEADDTNIQLVNLTLQSQTAVWSVEADDTNIQIVNLILQSQTAVWSVEADDTNIQLVNLTLQSQTELCKQWRNTIQKYNLWTSLYSLRQSCMISGGRRYKHTTCEPHSTVSDRAVWTVEADDTNIQLVNLTLQL